MQVKYKCENKMCDYHKERAYELIVSSESIMDEKNIATLFCPHCATKLTCEGEGCRTAA
jgi:hypothetical protein